MNGNAFPRADDANTERFDTAKAFKIYRETKGCLLEHISHHRKSIENVSLLFCYCQLDHVELNFC
jgi:hypothetical protein